MRPKSIFLRFCTRSGINRKTFSGSGLAVSSAPQLLSAANHLEIPTNNPNLLSPDILNQRRGNTYKR